MASYFVLALSVFAREVIGQTMADSDMDKPGMPHDKNKTESGGHSGDKATSDAPGHGHGDHGSSGSTNSATAGKPEMSMSHGDHQMSPFLFTRTTDFFVLFREANIQSTGGFIAALIVSFLFATIATIAIQVIHQVERRSLTSSSVSKIIASVLYAFGQLLHYTAMLIVMTMNVWLILAVTVGHLLGWLIFALFLGGRLAHSTGAAVKTEEM